MAIKWHTQLRDLDQDPASGPAGEIPLRLPNAASGLESSYTNAGQIYYDEDNTRLRCYINGSWTTIGAAGAASDADSIYNGGAWTVTVDANDVIWNLSTGFNQLINAASAGTTAAAIEINDNTTGTFTDGILFTAANSIVDAIDASSAGITNAINIGANAIAGTNFRVSAAGVVTSTGISDSGTAALSTMTAATGTITTLTSTTFNCPTIRSASSGNTALVVDAAGTGTITIAGTSTGAVTIGTATTITAGSFTLTNGDLVLSAGVIDIAPGAGDGDAIDMANLAANAAIDLDMVAASVAAGGIIDIDGSTGSAPVIEIAMSGAYTGDYVSLNMTNAVGAKAIDVTGAGTRTAALVHLTDVPTTSAPTIDMDITPGASIQAGIDIDVAGTSAADIITINFSAGHTGTAFLATMTNAVAGTAFEAVGSGTRTAPLVILTDTGGNAGSTLVINSTKSHATGGVIDIDEAGTSTNDMLSMDFSAAFAGDAINITMTNCAAGAQAIVIDGGQTAGTSNMVSITSSSAFASGTGRIMFLQSTGNLAAATGGACLDISETGNVQATSYAVRIASTNNEALHVDAGVVLVDESISNVGIVMTVGRGPNYIAAGGSNNAITGTLNDVAGTAVPLADGLMVLVDLQTLTLQAGGNTFNFNGGGALSIVSHNNVANNIGTAYTAQGHILLCYNAGATVWEDMSQ